ncbi:hypothetical protein CBS101457_004229 [Exobasidium rhododendri]|nr:hypothetical protein CBS101457_004229 [Exobasidium rhododendri]
MLALATSYRSSKVFLSRCFSATSASSRPTPSGFFTRPPAAPKVGLPRATRHTAIAQPHTPPHIPSEQSPNSATTWSESQNPRELAMRGPRFEQFNFDLQPLPLSAMEMIQREPIRLTTQRIIECDGGDGPLGHPKVFINLDKPGAKGCPYCGLRFERDQQHHHA